MHANTAKIGVYAHLLMAILVLGVLQQDASFEVISAASLSFSPLFLIFIYKFRASLTIDKKISF